MLRRFLVNYAARHQHPVNRWLHVIGLPMTFLVPIVLLWQGHPSWGLGSFVIGYLLQFAGHAVEGNDAGEVVLIKKILGMPYIDVVERPNESTG